MTLNSIVLTGDDLTIEKIDAVCRGSATVSLADNAKAAITANRAVIERKVKANEPVYGVTTGIGEFARISVSPEQGEQLQKRIIYSHAAGVGKEIPEAEVRACMLLRSNCLAKGYSGVRLKTVQTLIDMLNKRVHPVIYQKGSLGTSGDLSPLSQ
ncbi:MAG: aromatic amino acid lyase, partial [Candidatus Zixiibacteriota bacterium]